MVFKGMIKRVYCPLGGLSNQRLWYEKTWAHMGGGQTIENHFLGTNYKHVQKDLDLKSPN